MASILLAVVHAQLDAHNLELRRRIELETVTVTIHHGATAGGDQRRLRGIPAIGRGVQGHIPGTNPEHALEHVA